MNQNQYPSKYRRNIPVSGNYSLLKQNALDMRKNPTEAESIMWELLRNNNLDAKFRRQHIIGEFIVDFVDLKKGIVVEIDGGYHNDPEQQKQDDERSAFLKDYGFIVLRFSNDEVLYNSDKVVSNIKSKLNSLQ